MKPTMDDVKVVLAKFDATDWDELRIDAEDFHLHVYKSPRTDQQRGTGAVPPVVPAAPQVAADAEAPTTIDASAPKTPTSDGVVVRAPSLGSFYRAPKPGAAPYVEVGAKVTADSQLCLLEVMKLYTSVVAGTEGVVTEILVEDGSLVEHGQPLFVITPHRG
jgi:acetyl-CoA carboxylase biotin carboxyl carrier protein